MNKEIFRCSLCDAKSLVSFINTWRCNEGSHWTLQHRNVVCGVFFFSFFFFFDPSMFWLEMSLQWTPVSMTQSGPSALEIKRATTKAVWTGLNTHVLQERKPAVERPAGRGALQHPIKASMNGKKEQARRQRKGPMERHGHLDTKRAVGAPGLRGGPQTSLSMRITTQTGQWWVIEGADDLLQRTNFGHLENG